MLFTAFLPSLFSCSLFYNHETVFSLLEKWFSSHTNTGNVVKNCCLSAASRGPHFRHHFSHTIFTAQLPSQHTHISHFYRHPSCLPMDTYHRCTQHLFFIPIDLLIETSLICSLLLDIFFPSPVSFFSKLWQAVQILAVCCSSLILRQTFFFANIQRFQRKCSQTSDGHKDFPACDIQFLK